MRSRGRLSAISAPAILVVLALAAGPLTPSSAAPLDSSLVSRASGIGGVKGNGKSRQSAISADGRYVVFVSASTNLDPADAGSGADVYLRDRSSGATTLVSRATGAAGPKGNSASTRPMISADGRYVVFESEATNLDPDDGDSSADVYVRDLQTDATILVSRATGAAGAKGNAQSFRPSISGDGGRVAFQSSANNLSPDDGDANGDIFVRDLQAATTTLVSRATGAAGANADAEAVDAAISADGGHVAFTSSATNLDPADADANLDVFVRDLAAATTTLASRATGVAGAKGDQRSETPSISGDGGRVAFESLAANLDPDDGDSIADVFVRDLSAATTALASRASGVAGADGGGFEPSISRDGAHVAFHSFSTVLDPADTDTEFDVFVRDLSAATTALASRASGAAGAAGNGSSQLSQSGAQISADGGFVAFDSTATNLSPDDTDVIEDVFVRQLAGAGLSHSLAVTRAGGGTGSVTSDIAGIACGASCSASYAEGTVVTLVAAPAAGSEFQGWSGDCAGVGACTVEMGRARAVTATFTAKPPSGEGPRAAVCTPTNLAACDSSTAPPGWWRQCAIRTIRARVFLFPHKSRIRLVIRAKTRRAVTAVSASYEALTPKQFPIGTASAKLRKGGWRYRLEVGLRPAEMARIRATQRFEARFSVPGDSGWCNRAYTREIGKRKLVEGSWVWFQTNSSFVKGSLPSPSAPKGRSRIG